LHRLMLKENRSTSLGREMSGYFVSSFTSHVVFFLVPKILLSRSLQLHAPDKEVCASSKSNSFFTRLNASFPVRFGAPNRTSRNVKHAVSSISSDS
jgi:hypothetical protein